MIKLSTQAKRDLIEKTPIEMTWEGGQILLDTEGELWLVDNDSSLCNLDDGRLLQIDDVERDQYLKVKLNVTSVTVGERNHD